MPHCRHVAAAVAFGVWLATFPSFAACAESPQSRAAEDSGSARAEREYQKGMGYYAHGYRARAHAAFKEALRLDPQSVSARAAVRRLSLEVGSPALTNDATPELPAASPTDSLDDFLLRQIPRHFRFERTVGDARSDQGTLEAMLGRVHQLMSERRLALSRRRTFAKDRELRALVRRLPTVIA